MNKNKLIEHIVNRNEAFHGWWYGAALRCMALGHYRLIEGRRSEGIYLARFWLSKPKAGRHDDRQYESGNSVLLHWIIKDDDEDALHDHPWKFRTQIISGGYDEMLPSGPKIRRLICKSKGDIIEHKATDLHCVKNVQPDTWTLVTTGPHKRDWGFHPVGEKWQYYRDYLKLDED